MLEISNRYRVALAESGQTCTGAQGLTYGAGAPQDKVGARQICMSIPANPPGKRADAHYHEGNEMIDGRGAVYYGDQPEHSVVMNQNDHIYIPGGAARAQFDQLDAPYAVVVAHGSGSDQDGIEMQSHLDKLLDDV